MTVKELIDVLKGLPQNATVHIDDDGYASVEDVKLGTDIEDADPEDKPPTNSVLLVVE